MGFMRRDRSWRAHAIRASRPENRRWILPRARNCRAGPWDRAETSAPPPLAAAGRPETAASPQLQRAGGRDQRRQQRHAPGGQGGHLQRNGRPADLVAIDFREPQRLVRPHCNAVRAAVRRGYRILGKSAEDAAPAELVAVIFREPQRTAARTAL